MSENQQIDNIRRRIQLQRSTIYSSLAKPVPDSDMANQQIK
jgi:hypothetical protein